MFDVLNAVHLQNARATMLSRRDGRTH